MIKGIVNNWIDELLKKNNISNLNEIPKNILEDEIKEVQGTIENCKAFNDIDGIACNEYYLDLLEEVSGNISKKIYIRLRNKAYTITDGTTTDTGYFDRDLEDGVNEMILIEVANFCNYEPSKLLNFNDLI